jgi:hypothetical protein
MTSQVKGLVLFSLFNISVVDSKVPSSLKPTIHETLTFLHHTNKIHTQKSTSLLLTAKIFSQPGVQMCVASVTVQSWQTDFHGLHERVPWLVQHLCLI